MGDMEVRGSQPKAGGPLDQNPLEGAPSQKLRSVNYIMKYYVYILISLKDSSLYVGLTHDIKKRLQEHKDGLGGFTKGHLPYKLVFVSIFSDKFTAARFEKYLKSASGKAFIRKRILL